MTQKTPSALEALFDLYDFVRDQVPQDHPVMKQARLLVVRGFVDTGTIVKKCLSCEKIFEAGGNSGRRADAKFCSDQHRIKYNSDKRTS